MWRCSDKGKSWTVMTALKDHLVEKGVFDMSSADNYACYMSDLWTGLDGL